MTTDKSEAKFIRDIGVTETLVIEAFAFRQN